MSGSRLYTIGVVLAVAGIASLVFLRPDRHEVEELKLDPVAEALPTLDPTGLAEEIVFDEVDLYHHQRHHEPVYPSFSPARVRRRGLEYYFRQPSPEETTAASGERFGEIVLVAEHGALLYLPRDLRTEGAIGLQMYVRKSSPESRFAVTVRRDCDELVRFTEGGQHIPTVNDEWTRIIVPIDRFQVVDEKAPATDWNDPNFLLTRYTPEPSALLGVELTLQGRPGDRLEFDRISVLREGEPSRTLTGTVEPPAAGVPVRIATPARTATVETDIEGQFRWDVPEGVDRLEVLVETEAGTFAPTYGRYVEVGDRLPPLKIVTNETRPKTFPAGANALRYEWDEARGTIYRPNSHFGYGLAPDIREFFIEHTSNRLGYLDRDRRPERHDDAFRVAVIGECYFLGEHVAQQDLFAHQAEAILNFRGVGPVEVASTIFPYSPMFAGYPIAHELLETHELDMLVFTVVSPETFCYQVDEYAAAAHTCKPGSSQTYMFTLDGRSGLVHHPFDADWRLNALDVSYTPESRNEIIARYKSDELSRVDLTTGPPWAAEILEVGRRAFRMIVEEAAERNVRVAMLYAAPQRPASTNEYTRDGGTYRGDAFHRRMRELAADTGMIFLDISHIHADEKSVAWPNAGHWSPKGHYRAGRALADELQQRLPDRYDARDRRGRSARLESRDAPIDPERANPRGDHADHGRPDRSRVGRLESGQPIR